MFYSMPCRCAAGNARGEVRATGEAARHPEEESQVHVRGGKEEGRDVSVSWAKLSLVYVGGCLRDSHHVLARTPQKIFVGHLRKLVGTLGYAREACVVAHR